MEKTGKKNLLTVPLIIIVIFTIGIIFLVKGAGKENGEKAKVATGELAEFAQCLVDSGTKFYGAFWCPACAAQKDMFGDSVDGLPYVECSNLDKSQKPVCIAQKIGSYPTWKFGDGSVEKGVLSLTELAEKSDCTESLQKKDITAEVDLTAGETIVEDTEFEVNPEGE